MTKLNWIACNGVKPDLPEDTEASVVFCQGDSRARGNLNAMMDYIDWTKVTRYAFGSVDPVQELLDAAKQVAKFLPPYDKTDLRGFSRQISDYDKLAAAIKAVENTK